MSPRRGGEYHRDRREGEPAEGEHDDGAGAVPDEGGIRSHPPALVEEMHRVLKPDGFVIATVPAFKTLWGDEDDVAGHYRRYTKSTLAAEFTEHGFTLIRREYLYASLVAPAGFLRAVPYRLGRRSSREAVLESLRSQLTTRPSTDRFARTVLRAETAIAKVAPLPMGLTVLGAFKKR